MRPILPIVLLCGGLAAIPAAASAADSEHERLLFLVEYVGRDYAHAVHEGQVIDSFEHRELLGITAEIVDGLDVLRAHGASQAVEAEAMALRRGLLELAPREQVERAASTLAARLLRELDSVERAPASVDATRGAKVWAERCASCHGATAEGDGPEAAGLEPPVPSLTAEALPGLTSTQIVGALRFGIEGTAMRSFAGELDLAGMWDVAAHVARLRGEEPGAGGGAARARSAPPVSASGLDLALGLQDAFAEVARGVAPSVVAVTVLVREDATTSVDPAAARWDEEPRMATLYPGFTRLRSASGFFLDDEGHVLTVASAVARSDGEAAGDAIDLELHGGAHLLAEIVALEPSLDLAVLRPAALPARPPEMPAVRVGDSEAVEVGHWAIALGDPWGAERTYSVGILASQADRRCYQEELSRTLLQVSANVPPEAMGGPLATIRGEVIGMLVPGLIIAPELARSSGVTRALPMKLIEGIAAALVETGSRRSPWLGTSVLELAAARRSIGARKARLLPRTGVYIDNVFRGSPAWEAGVRAGDSIVSIDGHRLLSVLDFQRWLYLSGIGREVQVELAGRGGERTLPIRLEARPPEAIAR